MCYDCNFDSPPLICRILHNIENCCSNVESSNFYVVAVPLYEAYYIASEFILYFPIFYIRKCIDDAEAKCFSPQMPDDTERTPTPSSGTKKKSASAKKKSKPTDKPIPPFEPLEFRLQVHNSHSFDTNRRDSICLFSRAAPRFRVHPLPF